MALATLALVMLAVSPAAAKEVVAFVSAEDDDRLVAVQPITGRVLARIPVADGPHNVAASADGRFVLVTSPPAGRVTLVNGRSLRVLKVFSGLRYPHDVEIGQGGRYAYVTEERGGRVAVIDLVRRRVVSRVTVGDGPHDLALSDTLAWVTHGRSASTLTMLELGPPDRQAGRPVVIGRIAAGGPAHDIVHQGDTARVFVTYWDAGRVGAISGGVGRIRWRRDVGVLTHHVAFQSTVPRLWVTDHASGRLYVLSPRDGRLLRSLPVGPGPHHVAIAGGLAVATSHDAGTIIAYYTDIAGKVAVLAAGPTRVGRGLHGIALVARH